MPGPKQIRLLVASICIVLALLALLALRFYKTALVHHVVVHAVLQKAPPSVPDDFIEEAFAAARQRARAERKDSLYLEQLLEISRQLEKVQSLSESDIRQLLETLCGGARDG